MKLCSCLCGQFMPADSKQSVVYGHAKNLGQNMCGCGCGNLCKNKFVMGHVSRNRPHSEERKNLRRENQLNLWKDSDYRNMQSIAHLGYKQPEEVVKKRTVKMIATKLSRRKNILATICVCGCNQYASPGKKISLGT